MVCEHLAPLEKELSQRRMPERFRGKSWSDNCREWVYYDCIFSDHSKTMERLQLNPLFVKLHAHRGTHDGSESGFVCEVCHDGIMGIHPDDTPRIDMVTVFE